MSKPARHTLASRYAPGLIESDPERCGGRPTLKGTRLEVIDAVLLTSGQRRELIHRYPQLAAQGQLARLLTYCAERECESDTLHARCGGCVLGVWGQLRVWELAAGCGRRG